MVGWKAVSDFHLTKWMHILSSRGPPELRPLLRRPSHGLCLRVASFRHCHRNTIFNSTILDKRLVVARNHRQIAGMDLDSQGPQAAKARLGNPLRTDMLWKLY